MSLLDIIRYSFDMTNKIFIHRVDATFGILTRPKVFSGHVCMTKNLELKTLLRESRTSVFKFRRFPILIRFCLAF